MKKQYLRTLFMAAASLFFFSCAGGGGEHSDSANDTDGYAEETGSDTEEVSEPEDISQIMVAWHQVADFDTWKVVYDEYHDSILAGGMTPLTVGQSDSDPNYVFVAQVVNDLDAAMAFHASDHLKATMEEAGVSKPDVMTFLDVVYYGQPYRDNLARLMIRHKVADWEAWKSVFDEDEENAKANGLSLLFLGRDADDGNMVSVVFIIQDREKAATYVASDALKEKMEEAGVDGDVSITFFTLFEYSDVDA